MAQNIAQKLPKELTRRNPVKSYLCAMNVQKTESLMAINIALSKCSAEYIEPKKSPH